MKDDTISREAAIEAIKRAIWDKYTAKDAIDAVCNIPSAQRWIPVSERLPDPDNVYKDDPTYYLVQSEYGDMMVAKFIKFPGGARVWQQIHQYGAIMEDIVAWLPLPKPWKGKDSME